MIQNKIELAREKILNDTLLAFGVFGIPMVFSSLIRTLNIGWTFLFTWHIIVTTSLWVLFFFKKYFTLHVKVFSLSILALFTGIYGAWEWGLFGAWQIITVAAPIVITIFYGRQFGLIVLFIASGLLSVIAYMFIGGYLDVSEEVVVSNRSISFWVNAIVTIGLIITPVIISIGKVHQLFISNISELTKKKEELNNARNELRTIFEFIPIPILIINENNEIIRLNHRFNRLFGYSLKDIATLNDFFEKAFPEIPYREFVVNSWDKQVKNSHFNDTINQPDIITITGKDGKQSEIEVYFKRYDNNVMALFNDMSLQIQNFEEVKGNQQLLRDQNNDLMRLNQELLQSNDQVTEMNQKLLRAKQKAEESDHHKTIFLQNMSHEIRTPLNAIIGFSDLLSDSSLLKEQRGDYLDIISNSSKELLDTVNDIISVSSIEAGRSVVVEEPTNINSIFNSVASIYDLKASEVGLKFSSNLSLKDHEAVILMDHKKLKQVLINLINNAFKFTTKGKISIGYNLRSEFIVCYVKDTGVGIKQEYSQIIFERFNKGDDNIARKYSGTGLGLSISKSFIEMMGGRIWVISEEGKGSTFFFTIPYKPSESPFDA